MVSSETVPFSKSGGLADVLGALSPALVKKGEDVRIFMPMYSFIDHKGFRKGVSYKIPMLASEEEVSTVHRKLDGVEYIGLEHPYFSARKGIYGDTSFTPYPDNGERFMLFAKAAVLYMKASGWYADIVHCHDWTAGLVPFYVKEEGIKAHTVFTIHNLAYQGDFSRFDAVLGGDRLDSSFFYGKAGEERLNMLKAGLESADGITTVSPTYAEEIQTEKYGCGLDWLLRERKDDLKGILNGMDTHEWNSRTDKFFPEHYSVKDLSGKKALKERVLKKYGLIEDPSLPLFTMISRIADQKGYAELLGGNHPVLEELLCQKNFQMLIIGTGDKHYEEKLIDLAARHENLSVKIAFRSETAHEGEGAADFFLMPSRYEPCGLNQMYSLHYGTLPVAHRTGGLADTIIDITEHPDTGTGFLMENLSSEAIIDAVNRAIRFYNEEKENMVKAIRRAMTTDLSWDKSAGEYIELYNSLKNK